ncbi:hypothetical protein CIB48_g9783 [Xylaria polymorpha]|nr:hypothetical protein CIB48_g9783 [Xylaria polymorpha]
MARVGGTTYLFLAVKGKLRWGTGSTRYGVLGILLYYGTIDTLVLHIARGADASRWLMRASTLIASIGSSLLAAASALPPSVPSDHTINQPWTVTGFTVSGPDGQEVATFRVTAPDNYVTGVRGLDVLCEGVQYGLEWDTECASDKTFRLETSVSYQESYPQVQFKLNHVQIDASTVTIVTGEHFVLPADTFEFTVDTVAIGL